MNSLKLLSSPNMHCLSQRTQVQLFPLKGIGQSPPTLKHTYRFMLSVNACVLSKIYTYTHTVTGTFLSIHTDIHIFYHLQIHTCSVSRISGTTFCKSTLIKENPFTSMQVFAWTNCHVVQVYLAAVLWKKKKTQFVRVLKQFLMKRIG